MDCKRNYSDLLGGGIRTIKKKKKEERKKGLKSSVEKDTAVKRNIRKGVFGWRECPRRNCDIKKKRAGQKVCL